MVRARVKGIADALCLARNIFTAHWGEINPPVCNNVLAALCHFMMATE